MDTNQKADLLNDLIGRARRAGADAADAVFAEYRSLSAQQRLGRPEAVERSEGGDLGLRVMVGRRQAVVSSTDLSAPALDELVERCIGMARAVPEDPWAGLADPDQVAGELAGIDTVDPVEPEPDDLVRRAAEAEEAAMAVAGVTNSEGGEADWSLSRYLLAASNGFVGEFAQSSHGVSAVVLAGDGQDKERDYEFSAATHLADLADPAEVGRKAGERAVRRLNPRRPASAAVPVVYDPRVSSSLVRHLASAINGTAIARGTSFLKDAMGQQIFSPGIAIIDDAHRQRGLASRPFDGEGLATCRRSLVEDGHLRSWILDLASARQLGLASTGNASRSPGGTPHPGATNLHLAAGSTSPEELMADIDDGLYVTELMGSSVNMVTGDYSRGAGGFWIENGRVAWPVSDVTVAGNLLEMFAHLVPANDLEFRTSVNAPTLRIDGMTVAGPGG